MENEEKEQTKKKKSKTMVVDASNQIAGRIASRIAKELLNESKIFVVNAEKAVISGNPDFVINMYKERLKRGDPYHGPFYPRIPDRMLKRMIRGMVPYKKATGRAAMKRIKVFISVPEELKGKELRLIEEQKLENKFITIGDLAIKLGAKKTW